MVWKPEAAIIAAFVAALASIIVAFVTAIVTVWGWIVTRRREDRSRAIERRLERCDRQIEECYGPLYDRVRQIVNVFFAIDEIRKYSRLSDGDDESVKKYLNEHFYFPLHEEALNILRTRMHLVPVASEGFDLKLMPPGMEMPTEGENGCDLRLMSSVNDVSGIPTEGKNLIIVAAMNHVLHFRIFDSDGKVVVDTDEKRLTEQAQQITDLRKQLESLWPPNEMTRSDKDRVVTAVTSIVGHTRENLVIIADVRNVLRFRIFNDGEMVEDRDENRLLSDEENQLLKERKKGEIAELKSLLSPLWGVPQLSRSEKDRIITKVQSVTCCSIELELWKYNLHVNQQRVKHELIFNAGVPAENIKFNWEPWPQDLWPNLQRGLKIARRQQEGLLQERMRLVHDSSIAQRLARWWGKTQQWYVKFRGTGKR